MRRYLLPLAFAVLVTGSASAQLAPGFSKAFADPVIGPGSLTALTFTIDNTDSPGAAVSNLAFVDNLPGVMTVATPAGASTTCSGGRDGTPPVLSAPEGGGVITFSGGSVAPGARCTVTVYVTAATAGSYVNVTSDLTSSAGNSGSAQATLDVDASRPGFTKAFSPAAIFPDARTTLTFTFDNSAGPVNITNLQFQDPLPPGVVVADPANVSTTCRDTNVNPTITATPGAGDIAFTVFGFDAAGFRPLPAGQTCTVSVDVTATSGGRKENVTGVASTNVGTVGRAGAVLDVVSPSALSANVVFTNDPVQPGGQVQVLFRVFNRDRTRTYTDIAFTDDLEATLAGLAPSAPLPTNPCGPGSALTGASTLSLTGGTLAPGESCGFRVTLLVPPGAAPGTYPNVTSVLTANADGDPIAGTPGSGELVVTQAPTLELEYVEGTIVAGGTLTARYTITNVSATSAATGILFQDTFSGQIPFPVQSLPAPGFCGPSAVAFQDTNSGFVQVQNASLDPGASCTFDVGLAIPESFAGGPYTTETGALSATVDGALVTGSTATGTFAVIGLPTLTKSFETAASPGGTVTLTFGIEHDGNAEASALALSFTDDLDAALAGLEAQGTPLADVCGPGSQLSGTSTLTLTGGSLEPGGSCEFSVDLAVPASAPVGTATNTTSGLSLTLDGTPYTAGPASADLLVSPLVASKAFTDDPVAPGGQVTLEYTFQNAAPSGAISDLFLVDAIGSTLPGLAAQGTPQSDVCGPGSSLSGTTTLILSGASLAAGASCTVSVTLAVPAGAADGQYTSTTSAIQAQYDGAAFTNPPLSAALEVAAPAGPVFTKAFTPDEIEVGGTSTLTFTIDNSANEGAATSLAFTDAFPDGLAVASPANASTTCTGGTLSTLSGVSYTGGTVSAGAVCTVSVDVTAGSPGTYVNVSGDLTSSLGNSGPAQATLEVGASTLVPTKVDALADANTNGFADEGETIHYVITLANEGAAPTDPATLVDEPDVNTTLVAGSVTTTAGTVTSGNTPGDTSVAVAAGTIPGGGAVTVEFDVVVTPVVEEPPPICNQGTVSVGPREIDTDDPDTEGVDATCTPTDRPPIDLVIPSYTVVRGGDLVPQITIENSTSTPITTQIRILVQDPTGETTRYRTRRGTIDPGGPYGPYPAGIVPIPSDAPAGTYTVVVTARRTAGNALLDDERFTFDLPPAPVLTVEAAALTREGGLEATVSVVNADGDPRAYTTRLTLEDPMGASTRHAGRSVEDGGAALRAPLAAGAPDGTYRVRVEVLDPETDAVVASETVEVALGASMAAADAAALAAVEPGAMPNPFRTATTIRYALEAEADVSLRVFDVTGREVAVLAAGRQEAGLYTVPFEAEGRPAGVYVWRLVVDGEPTVGQVTLVR